MTSFIRQLLALSNPSEYDEDWFFASERAHNRERELRPLERRGRGERAHPPQGQFFERSV